MIKAIKQQLTIDQNKEYIVIIGILSPVIIDHYFLCLIYQYSYPYYRKHITWYVTPYTHLSYKTLTHCPSYVIRIIQLQLLYNNRNYISIIIQNVNMFL